MSAAEGLESCGPHSVETSGASGLAHGHLEAGPCLVVPTVPWRRSAARLVLAEVELPQAPDWALGVLGLWIRVAAVPSQCVESWSAVLAVPLLAPSPLARCRG